MLNAKPKLEKSSAYGEFQQDRENRDINENHVRRLCKSMQKHGFLEASHSMLPTAAGRS